MTREEAAKILARQFGTTAELAGKLARKVLDELESDGLQKKADALQQEVWSLGQSNEALQARIVQFEAELRSVLRERNTYRNEVDRRYAGLTQLPLEYVYAGDEEKENDCG